MTPHPNFGSRVGGGGARGAYKRQFSFDDRRVPLQPHGPPQRSVQLPPCLTRSRGEGLRVQPWPPAAPDGRPMVARWPPAA